MKRLTQQAVDFIKIRLEKALDSKSVAYKDFMDLCDNVSLLAKENTELKGQLLDIDLSVPPDKNWESILASKLNRAISSNEKEYLEITNSTNNDIFIITVTKKFGKTPEQLLEQSQIRRLKAEKKLELILKENKELEDKLAANRRTVDVLTVLRTEPATIEAQTLEELKHIIVVVNSLIGKFNAYTWRKKITQLHSSMQEAYHQAWHQAADSDFKARTLEEENKKLRLDISKRKSPISKIRIKKRARRS